MNRKLLTLYKVLNHYEPEQQRHSSIPYTTGSGRLQRILSREIREKKERKNMGIIHLRLSCCKIADRIRIQFQLYDEVIALPMLNMLKQCGKYLNQCSQISLTWNENIHVIFIALQSGRWRFRTFATNC